MYLSNRSAFAGYFVMESTLCLFLVFKVRCKSRLNSAISACVPLVSIGKHSNDFCSCFDARESLLFDALNKFQHRITVEIAFGLYYGVKILGVVMGLWLPWGTSPSVKVSEWLSW